MNNVDKKRAIVEYIDQYQSKSLLKRISRKLSYFHKQVYMKYLIQTGKYHKMEVPILTGQVMNIVLPDNISSCLYTSKFFEVEETKGFVQLVDKDCIFLDIGSHIGYYSVLARHLGGENCKIISIEPTPSTFDILKKNTNFPNSIQLNIAMYSSTGKMTLNDYGYRYMSLNSLKDARLDEKIEGKKIEVELDTVDNIVNKYKLKPTLIKIDAESAEVEILKGASDTINAFKPHFFIEVGDFETIDKEGSIKIIDLLANYSYMPLEYNNGFYPHKKRNEAYPSMSLFFIHESNIKKLNIKQS